MSWGRILLAAFTICSTPVVAQKIDPDAEYSRHGGWQVSRNNGECISIGFFGNLENALMIGYNGRSREVTLMFTDPTIKSLKAGDTRKLRILLVTGESLNERWGEKTFYVGVTDAHTSFMTALNDDFLTDFARHEKLGFFYGKAIIQSFNLANNAAMVESLKDCALSEARLRPRDPFR